MIDTHDLSTHERLRLMVPRESDHMMLPTHRVHESGGTAMVMVIPHTQAPSDAAYLRLVVLLVLMLLGLYVMWRGRDAASLGLGIFFTMMPAFLGLSHAYSGLPDQAIIAVLFLATMLNLLGYFGLYFMVDALAGASMSPSVRTIARTVVVVALVVACTILFSAIYGRVFTGCLPPVGVPIVLACYATVIGVCFFMLWRGIVASDRGERGRLRWLFWSTITRLFRSVAHLCLDLERSPNPVARRVQSQLFGDSDRVHVRGSTTPRHRCRLRPDSNAFANDIDHGRRCGFHSRRSSNRASGHQS